MNEDNYNVTVNLSFSQTGHHDAQFPDTDWSMGFDATDSTLETMFDKFKQMLIAMGYVVEGSTIKMVDD